MGVIYDVMKLPAFYITIAGMAWALKHHLAGLTRVSSIRELPAEIARLLYIFGPFTWFGLRCKDVELGAPALIGAVSGKLLLLVLSCLLSPSRVQEKPEKKKNKKEKK